MLALVFVATSAQASDVTWGPRLGGELGRFNWRDAAGGTLDVGLGVRSQHFEYRASLGFLGLYHELGFALPDTEDYEGTLFAATLGAEVRWRLARSFAVGGGVTLGMGAFSRVGTGIAFREGQWAPFERAGGPTGPEWIPLSRFCLSPAIVTLGLVELEAFVSYSPPSAGTFLDPFIRDATLPFGGGVRVGLALPLELPSADVSPRPKHLPWVATLSGTAGVMYPGGFDFRVAVGPELAWPLVVVRPRGVIGLTAFWSDVLPQTALETEVLFQLHERIAIGVAAAIGIGVMFSTATEPNRWQWEDRSNRPTITIDGTLLPFVFALDEGRRVEFAALVGGGVQLVGHGAAWWEPQLRLSGGLRLGVRFG